MNELPAERITNGSLNVQFVYSPWYVNCSSSLFHLHRRLHLLLTSKFILELSISINRLPFISIHLLTGKSGTLLELCITNPFIFLTGNHSKSRSRFSSNGSGHDRYIYNVGGYAHPYALKIPINYRVPLCSLGVHRFYRHWF